MSLANDRLRIERSTQITPEFEPGEKHEAIMAALWRRYGVKLPEGEQDTEGFKIELLHMRSPSSVNVSGAHELTNGLVAQHELGGIMTALYQWGYMTKLATGTPKACFTPKGWAFLMLKGHMDERLLLVVCGVADNRVTAKELLAKMRSRERLADAAKLDEGHIAGIVEDVLDTGVLADLPFVEPPGLPDAPSFTLREPEFGAEIDAIIAKRKTDRQQVDLARQSVATKYRGLINNMGIADNESALTRFFTDEEILRADLEADSVAHAGDTFYRHELVSRMSKAGHFKAHTLADHVEPGLRLHGVDKIAAGLEARSLEQEGRKMGLSGDTTLGAVHDRISRESISGMADAAEELHDDYLPIVDWIDKEFAGHGAAVRAETDPPIPGEPFVSMDTAKLIARQAVLRSVRQRILRDPLRLPDDLMSHRHSWRGMLEQCLDSAPEPVVGEQDDRSYYLHELNTFDRVCAELDAMQASGEIPPDTRRPMNVMDGAGNAVGFNGSALQVKRQISFEGRNASLLLTVDSDYDPADTENVVGWFDKFVAAGILMRYGRSYSYPAGANITHEKVGELEAITVTGISPYRTLGMGILGGLIGGLVSLGGLLIVLATLVPHAG